MAWVELTIRHQVGTEVHLKQVLQSSRTRVSELAAVPVPGIARGRGLPLDKYRRLIGDGWPGFRKINLWRQERGQKTCARAFVDAVAQRGATPIPVEDVLEVARVSIEVAERAR